ncbi:MAG: hypothetical protein V3S66_04045 [Desulfobacterales bacterium]
MRTIFPVKNNAASESKTPPPVREVVFDFRIPFRLLRERFALKFTIHRISPPAVRGYALTPSMRRMNTVITYVIISFLFLVFISGLVFLVYLIKSVLVIDIFPQSHVFTQGLGG